MLDIKTNRIISKTLKFFEIYFVSDCILSLPTEDKILISFNQILTKAEEEKRVKANQRLFVQEIMTVMKT